MRLHELDRQQVNEAAQALALPVIGFVSPAAANAILTALGMGATGLAAYYTSKELQKVKIDFPGAWENISSALEKTGEQISNGAMMANPTIMTAIILKKFMDNPESFNNPETVNSAINSSAEESMKTNVGARPEVTASGGRTKKNQLARQAAWDAAYGQTHLYNGEANPDAGKIDPGLVRAQAALSAKIEAEAQANRENSLANTIANNVPPTVMTQTQQLQTQTNDEIKNSGITSFNDADVTVNKEISTLKPVEINTDKPTIGIVNPNEINVTTQIDQPKVVGTDNTGATTVTKTIDPPDVPKSAPKLTIPNSISANTSLNVPGYDAPVKVQSVSPRGIVATTTDGQTVNFRTQKEIDAITVNKVTPTLAQPKTTDNDVTITIPKDTIGQNDINVGDLSKGDQAAGANAQGGGAGGATTTGGTTAGAPPIAVPVPGTTGIGARSGAQTGATANTDAGTVATTKTRGAPPGKGKKIGGFKLPKIPGAKGLDMDLIKWQELEPSDPLGLRTMGKGGEK